MAAKVKGIAHLYGVSGTVSNATVLSTQFKESHKLEDATTDESGVEIERRYDDEHVEGTITIRMKDGYTPPAAADLITYNAVAYEIVSIDKNEEAKGFRTLVLNIKKSQGISYS